ncbi:signal peptidase II [Candidatus Woesearchaeota archaeon]|nr:signal peptidase II [Candidatus Woesearchaeota archaeon]
MVEKMAKRFLLLFWSVAVFVLFLDQLTKWLIAEFRPDWQGGVLRVHLVANTGAGFGILPGWTLILTIISFLVALAVLFFYPKIEKEKMPQILFALFLGGVLGNGMDRLFLGAVRDFIDLSFWPAFNVADAALSVAVVGLVWWYGRK